MACIVNGELRFYRSWASEIGTLSAWIVFISFTGTGYDNMAEKSGLERVPVRVLITLDNADQVRGSIKVPRGHSLGDTLNSGDQFVLVDHTDGHPTYLSLASIREIKSSQLPAAEQINQAEKRAANASAHQILGLEAEFSRDQLHQRYHDMTKLYHPDHYATIELPDEVSTYISDMARRINMAYTELENDLKVQEKEEKRRQELQEAMGPAREFKARA